MTFNYSSVFYFKCLKMIAPFFHIIDNYTMRNLLSPQVIIYQLIRCPTHQIPSHQVSTHQVFGQLIIYQLDLSNLTRAFNKVYLNVKRMTAIRDRCFYILAHVHTHKTLRQKKLVKNLSESQDFDKFT